jgi:O-antigen/teichoic acid export membrane protein
MESIGKKIIRNTVYNSMGRIWQMLVLLLLTPYILHKLGVELFAVWSLVFVVANYLGLLDFGVRTSFAKYIAEYHTKGDQEAINAVLNCGLVFYLSLSVLIVGLTVILRGSIASLLSIPPAIYSQSMFAILGMVLVFSLSNTFSIFEAVLVGLQRMDVQNKILILASFFNVGGTFFFLESGYGIRGLVINQGIFTLVIVLLNAVFSRRLAPYLRLGLSRMRKDVFRKLFSFGTKMQICNFAVMVHSQADKIILSHFLGLSFVTFYELGQKAANAVRTFPMLLLTALVPAVSEMDAGNDHERMMRLYHRGSKYVSLMVFPLIFFSIIVARNVFDLWVGDGFGLAVLAFQILVIGYGINVLTGMGTSMVRGIGKPEYETRYAVLALVTQLVLSIVLVQVIGFRGVLISVLVTAVLAALYFLITFHKLFNIGFSDFAKQVYIKPLVSSVFAAAIAFGAGFYLKSLVFFSSNWGRVVWLVLESSIFVICYLSALAKTSYLNRTEVESVAVHLRPKLASRICSLFGH